LTGGPTGSATPLELELLEELEDDEELLDALELLELELELLLSVPLELPLPPQAARAAANTSATLDLVSPARPSDFKLTYINTSPLFVLLNL